MKNTTKKLSALLLLLTISSFAYPQSIKVNEEARIKIHSVKAGDDENKILALCRDTPQVPKGWVIVGEGNVDACRRNSIAQPLTNAWFIKKPAKEEAVCQGSPLPDSYVVVGRVKIAGCPGGSSIIMEENGWIIRLIE